MESKYGRRPVVKFVKLTQSENIIHPIHVYTETIERINYDIKDAISPFLPQKAVDEVTRMLKKNHVELQIESPRIKYIGLCSSYQKKIWINNTLEKDRFLSTFIHEYAHLLTGLNFTKVQSHGVEFYYCFEQIVVHFINKKIISEKMFLPILDRDSSYSTLKKHYQFVFDLKKIRVGSKVIYENEVIIRGKGHHGDILCTKLADNSNIKLKPKTPVLPVLDLEF